MRKLVAMLTTLGALALSAPAQAYEPWITDPTGQTSPEKPLTGLNHGSTRGPGANPVQPESSGPPTYPPPVHGGARPWLGSVPTDQQLAKGAPPAVPVLGPIPRPAQSEPLLQQLHAPHGHW